MRCYFHDDLDGKCSAAIVRRRYPNESISFIPMQYNHRIDINLIEKNETIYIVDFSFKPEVMEEIFKITFHVIWIDHHKTAIEYKYSRNVDGIRRTDSAACKLTWEYCFPDIEVPAAVELLSDYDNWNMKYNPQCKQFHEGMKAAEYNPDVQIWKDLFNDNSLVKCIVDNGIKFMKYRDIYCRGIRQRNGYVVDFEGHRCYVLNLQGFGSQGFGVLFYNYDLCISYIFDGVYYIVSLYSDKKTDVSKIAKKYGGGGHAGAAGFITQMLPFTRARRPDSSECCTS